MKGNVRVVEQYDGHLNRLSCLHARRDFIRCVMVGRHQQH